jgi:hypothetical protein
MNIFVLDEDPERAAWCLTDEHLVQTIVDAAQVLSTFDGKPPLDAHRDHPCVEWIGSYHSNYRWYAKHAIAAAAEYKLRFGFDHKNASLVQSLDHPPIRLPYGKSSHVLAMPGCFKIPESPVDSYRFYYKNLVSKARYKDQLRRGARWTNRSMPTWLEKYFDNLRKPNELSTQSVSSPGLAIQPQG